MAANVILLQALSKTQNRTLAGFYVKVLIKLFQKFVGFGAESHDFFCHNRPWITLNRQLSFVSPDSRDKHHQQNPTPPYNGMLHIIARRCITIH